MPPTLSPLLFSGLVFFFPLWKSLERKHYRCYIISKIGHYENFRVAYNKHLRNARIKVALQECIKIVRFHDYIYFYHITKAYIKKQFKSIFDSFYLFITLAFNPLLKPYSSSFLKQPESTCKYPTTATTGNVIYFTLNSYVYHWKKKNNQICIFYMRLNNLKFSKHTMD